MKGPFPAIEFVNSTSLMKVEGKWTPEAVLIYELMKRLTEVEPHPEGLVVQNARTRQMIMEIPEIPEDASLIIQVIGDNQIRITTCEPIKEEEGRT